MAQVKVPPPRRRLRRAAPAGPDLPGAGAEEVRHPRQLWILRLVVSAAAGTATAVTVGLLGDWAFAPSAGWVCMASLFVVWTLATVAPMDAEQTAAHATREDPSKTISQLLILGASVASLVAVGYLLVQASAATGTAQAIAAGLGVLSVAVSWLVVHTLFTLRYALLYYSGRDGGIDFNGSEPPRYSDFAYLSFTIGMTFQVSDTTLTSRAMRAAVLRHSLLSYLFGSLILAATVNLVASLASATT
jgi:uncharacterized membrane protein